MRSYPSVNIILLLVMLVGLSGCLKKESLPATTMTAKFLASTHLNPNVDGDSSPLVVRVYELKSDGAFKNSDFFTLYDDDSQALAEELVAKDEFRFNPDESKVINKELDPNTRYIGVMAAFRDLDQSIWRKVMPIKEHQMNSFTILLGRNEISVTEAQ